MKRFALPAVVAALVLSAGVQAEVVVEWVTVGDPGNTGELSGEGTGPSGYGPDRICGAVNYVYRIAKYEITNSQYCEFLNAVAATDTYGLYNPNMAGGYEDAGGITQAGSPGSYTYTVRSGRDDNPVNYVNFFDALRLANWMHNGQPTGAQDSSTTEDGAYTFFGAASVGSRNRGARVVLPSEDEWYKAAYYKGGGTEAGYWDYATRSDAQPTAEPPLGGANSVNYNWHVAGHRLTDVGSYPQSVGPYGTFDQNGNLWEWNEALIDTSRGKRGGSYSSNAMRLRAGYRDSLPPGSGWDRMTVRLACPAQPPPVPAVSGWGLAAMTTAVLTASAVLLRRRHAAQTTG